MGMIEETKTGYSPVDQETLIVRVNELYHDFQAHAFNDVHQRRHRAERVFWEDEVLPRVARMEGHMGVDLCTGTGFVPRILLSGTQPGVKILCVDISPKSLAETRVTLGKLADRAEFHPGDAATIPVGDCSVDWVTLNAGLHHVPNPDTVLQEIDRVLKPGGIFCLGHEPNQQFFDSPALHRLERLIWHAFWYLSPRHNLRRVNKMLGWQTNELEGYEHLQEINRVLCEEGLVSTPLNREELRRLVDVNTHSDDADHDKAGFDVQQLIDRSFPTYTVAKVAHTDYGGEMLRKCRPLRVAFDGLMRRVAPGRGRLFSLILQKPELRGN
jgi:ubiquinone/menaquinone biosynthesis C-methylase UbiE